MKIERHWNTKKRGIIEFLFYKTDSRYVGVCLTFDILEEGKDMEKLKDSVEEAARLHLKVVQKEELSDKLLNRYAPVEYWERYLKLLKPIAKKRAENNIRQNFTTLSFNYPLTPCVA